MADIYTKTGDEGKTSFFNGDRVSKDDPRIEAYGVIDELNSCIGVSVSLIDDDMVSDILVDVQNDLFTLGSELASLTSEESSDMPEVSEDQLNRLEDNIDEVDDELPSQTSFILPGGASGSSFLHFSRSICRRAERRVTTVMDEFESVNPFILKYVNRLSDLLYILARYINKEVGIKEQQPIYEYIDDEKENSEEE